VCSASEPVPPNGKMHCDSPRNFCSSKCSDDHQQSEAMAFNQLQPLCLQMGQLCAESRLGRYASALHALRLPKLASIL
jgi:hypothetical protein